MADPAGWRELAAQFKKLWDADYGLKLYACWSSTPYNDRGEHWFVAGSPEQSIIDSFLRIVERAAVLLGRPTGPATLFYWLDLLKENSPRYQGGGSSETHHADGIVIKAETGSIASVCLASAEYCYELETLAIAQQTFADSNTSLLAETPEARTEPAALRDRYLAQFPEKIKILDICWAAHQHYSEWKRWLRSAVKKGSTADLNFRAILASAKRPGEYRKQPRPSGWQ